ncbi:MAG: MYXO-CTERM sorting domain-containing protein [Polyangiaceae bacterium]
MDLASAAPSATDPFSGSFYARSSPASPRVRAGVFRLFSGVRRSTDSHHLRRDLDHVVAGPAQRFGNPNGEQTTGWFRISATNPGTCDDVFGTRVPAAGGTDLGSGAVSVPYSILATGLTSGVTYYFCAIVSNASGKAFGGILSFTVPGSPIVTTNAATSVTSTTAILEGSANPNSAASTGWYRYSTTNPGTCDDLFGTRAPASGGTSLGSGTSPVNYTRSISSLLPGTTYYFCAIASNTYGTSFGTVQSFTTSPVAPVVTTNNATLITGNTAQLNGGANPGGATTTGWFRYATTSPGTCNDVFGTRAPSSGGSNLGTGNSNVNYGLGITGLLPATTYYFCAIASNSVGTAFGSVLSFTTPAPPTVTTVSVTSIGATSAQLNGSGNPNGSATTGWFRYSLTDPGTCNDVFGSRAPVAGGSNLGSGTSAISYSQSISGLSSNTTYYWCAIAQNSEGLAYGAVQSFVTSAAPVTTTLPATLVTSTTATLNGNADPNGNLTRATTATRRRTRASATTCSASARLRRAPATPRSARARRRWRSRARSAASSRRRPITSARSPTTRTARRTARSTRSRRSRTRPRRRRTTPRCSRARPRSSTVRRTPAARPDDRVVPLRDGEPRHLQRLVRHARAPASNRGEPGLRQQQRQLQPGITGLTAGTTYYFCAIAENAVGMTFGAVNTFITPLPPTVATYSVTSLTNSSATLNGAGTPNGSLTTGWFRYSVTDPGTCDDSFGSRAPASGGTNLGSGYTLLSIAQGITGLSAGTTYYYCAIASSFEGIAFGDVLSFTTPTAPTATTAAATSITSSSATLNGSGDPNGNTAKGYYRYATTDPGTCSDAFGIRAPSSSASDTSLGAGTVDVPFARSISGLLPGTTYYYCAIVYNSYGTAYGAIMSFTTLANAPSVTTNNASLLTSTTAQLNGVANPGGSATTGWFRYATTSPGTCNDSFGTRAPAAGGANVGAGTSNVNYNQGITGLSAATTYYYCAIAQNGVGISLGSVVSFTTPTPPTVTTNAATSLTNASAQLNGSANPNGSATTGWFRYSISDPGNCDDVFGSRAPLSGGSNLGSGSSAISYSQSITGLSAGTTYYYCAIAQSGEGIAFGQILTFTTPTVPVTTTTAATLVTSTTVTLNGTADPNGNSAFGYFRYATSNPGLCNDLFGTRAPPSSASDSSLGAGTTPVPFSRALTGLTPATTYYYCALGRNSYGTTFGSVMSFTTLPNLPVVTTTGASLLTGTTAQLNGSANPGGATTTGWFRYATASPGTCNDSFGTRAPAAGGAALGAGNSNVAYNQGITGLAAGTTYYYCAIAENSAGTAVGAVSSFTTPLPPVAATTGFASLTINSATLQGVAIPNGSATTGYFRYSLTDPGTCDDSFGSRAPASGGSSLGSGYSTVNYSQSVSGLSAGTTYYFCAIAQSFEGTAFGAIMSFTTPDLPVTTTLAATNITSSSATLNGSANPNGNSAFGYYRYATTDPGTCSDSFGIRAPSSSASDTSLGSGTSAVTFARTISGLVPATTYYYCALGRNSYGTTFGAVMSFTTQANAPTVTTNSASLLTGTTAQLNGTANPGGAATTGWFRYATASPGSCNDSFGTRAPAAGGASLGSGNSNVTYNQGITGLVAGTTYFYCAIAENAAGMSFGAVVSFTTPLPPSVTTGSVTSLTNTSATLNGSANPNGSTSTGYFRYGLTDPGTCDDSFGSRAPASGGSNLGSGTSSVSYAQSISGLSPGTTYYYCAIATSAEGIDFGAVLSFTTPTAPTTTTLAATSITSSSATLNGSANPNGNSAFGYYRYSTTNPGVCSDVFGVRAPSSSASDTSLGSGSAPVAFARSISGLTPGTTYYYCALGRNTYGTTFGAVLSFTTQATLPTVTTGSATAITTTSATLNATSNPNGDATTGWFRFATASPGSCNDSFGTRAPASGGSSLGAGVSNVAYSQGITGLTPNTTYYYCAIVENAVGMSFGSVLTFKTTAPPDVATLAATPVTSTTATLNGVVTPNGFTTTGWFRYSTTNPGTCDQAFGVATPTQSLGSGTSPVSLAQSLSGLVPATTYYFCAIAQSSIGTTLGAVLSFTTPAAPPSVTTTAATDITAVSATLNATINPNGGDSTGWFRYSTTNPGTCNDAFGTRLPASGGTALGLGNTPVNMSMSATMLTTGTTYYFCALASSSVGTSVGTILSFTTAALPAVTTTAATAITATGATINGSANPSAAATTGWFRYSTTNPGTCDDVFGTRAPASGGTSLGSGSTAVPYSQVLTGLVSGTTYYYCAIAENVVGKGFGSVLSFTTAAVPIVTTTAASSVASTTATVNGTASPNNLSATGWFRYSTVDPGTCNDVFGTRSPASGGTALGSGNAAVPYSRALTGLVASTTYYYCAIASNSAGTGLGTVMTFTTLATPTVTTSAATSVTSTTATLNGSGNPKLDAATGYFRYATTNPGSCNDVFGTRAPVSGGTALGSGNTAVPFSEPITGLTAGTTYYFCAIAQNAIGTGFGSVLTFTTTAAPVVTTNAASAVTSSTATLNGSGNPKLAATTGWFRYDTTDPGTCDDSFGTRAPAAGGSNLGSGNAAVAYSQGVTGLTSATTYYFCAIAQNAAGTSFGAVQSFTTASAPSVTTAAATSVGTTTATVNGSANPNLLAATGWYRYSATDPGTCNDSFGTRSPASGGTALGSGNAPVAYSRSLTGLTSGTTYYYCAIASNSAGTGFGAVMTFTTAGIPTVTTNAATAVTNSTATLNASATPNLLTATGYFRYSATNPGTCNDVFGTRAPASGGAALGAGSAPVDYAQPITGLTPNTTYYYCGIAQNGAGTGLGSILTFTTLAAPTTTTAAATAVSSSNATLNGSADPNGDAATGYFRYSTTNPGSCNDVFGTRAPASGGTALGSGTTAVPFSQSITGLAGGTTYYYCAIAQNSVGTGFGTLMTFTTSAGPAVTTLAASAVTPTGATLNGSANPNLAATSGWFRYSATDPGACDDTFGTRAPSSGGTSLGAGNAPVSYFESITGLANGTTYFYCAIAQNSVGTSFGTLLTFTTPAAPTVVTQPPSNVTATTALLNGSANPNLSSATGHFRYSTTNPGTCDDSFGTRAPAAGGAPLGSGGSPVAYAQPINGLTPGTVYYVCAIATNAAGAGFGQVEMFATPSAPAVATVDATAITSTDATLNGTGTPNYANTTGWFRYSPTNPGSCNDAFGTRAPSSGGAALGQGGTPVDFSQSVTGLTPGTTYFYCAIAENTLGKAFGALMTFTTLAKPVVITLAATNITDSGATLNATGNPKLLDATGWFRYSETNPGACDDAFGTRVPVAGGTPLGAGSSDVPFTEVLSALTPGTTYYYCAIAENAEGVSFGAVMSFTTLAPPSVTTELATGVVSTAAVLNGTANPNQVSTTAWFRYDTVDPGTCDDSFGTRVPFIGGTVLPPGSTSVPFSEAVLGLMPLTTYYYCAIAESALGTSFGDVLSFTTSGAPIVTTVDAADITSTTATLNGTANANLSESTAWFRYDTVDPGTCDDTFGTRLPDTGGTLIDAAETEAAFSEAVKDLLPGTTYYFCAIAENAAGLSFGEVLTFTTDAEPPAVVTSPPTSVTATSANLKGSANPNGDATIAWFRYDTVDPVECNDAFGTRFPDMDGFDAGAGTDPVPYSEPLTGLQPGVKYFYCAVAENSKGKGFGKVQFFVTGVAPPDVTTDDATGVTAVDATLVGKATPNGSPTTGWFRLGDTETDKCDDSYGKRIPDAGGSALGFGTDPVDFNEVLADLDPNKTYYFCAAASNSAGAEFGEVFSFTTDKAPPDVQTSPAVIVSGAVALNGLANPRGTASLAWFRYASEDPGECDDTFGTRVPTDGIDLGDGRDDVPITENIGELDPGTYYYCAIAFNEAGTTFGEIQSFEIIDATKPDPDTPGDGGCGCRVSSPTSRAPAASLSFLALALLVFRRRRRRPS